MKKNIKEFKAFVSLYTGKAAVLSTPILVFEPFSDIQQEQTAKRIKITATWDTGATNTCIKQDILESLGLTPIGKTTIYTANGEEVAEKFIVNLVLPNGVGIPGLTVTGLKKLNNTECLIGMDIISAGDFSITTKDGNSCISYRIPSIERIDYVYEYNKQIFGGVKPYEPCPCKSRDQYGKPISFRNCHMPMFHPINNNDKTEFFPG